MTKILGKAVATADQMAAYLLSINKNPKIDIPVRDFCQLFLTEAAKEGVRGDALFAQSCKETGHFKYGGTVTPDQNNYAGLGTVNASTKGAYFPDEATGILAQAQHAKGYATREPLSRPCVDPRYKLLVQYGKAGTAQNWEDLGGKWAVPGFDTKRYASILGANHARDSYGYHIIDILNKILEMPTEQSTERGEDTMKTPIIALDAGHGMKTSGKRCLKAIDPNQTREWYLNDRIMDRVQELLAGYNCKVVRTDDTTGVKDISLSARAKTANSAKADIFISMHHNAGINGGTGGGTEVYYYSSKEERATQAQKLYNAIVAQTGLRGNRSKKVIKKGYTVLAKTNMAAFLVENGFMDSRVDTPQILTKAHAEKTAQGVVSFLVGELGLTKKKGAGNGKSEATAPSVGTVTYYPAYTGKQTTLSAALTSLKINSTYAFRKKIAAANNIKGYCGTASQNTQMYNLLKAGLLKRA